MKYALFFLFASLVHMVYAQPVVVKVLSSGTGEPLAGASVKIKETGQTIIAGGNGICLLTSNESKVHLHASYSGYRDTTVECPMQAVKDTFFIWLQPQEKAEEVVVVTSTRTNSRIADLPMRVEVLGSEDLDEETGIKPGNMTSLLGDLSVIHIQNTSATNGNAAIRMQGLGGRYTQLLRDGLPVYEGLTSNFGVLSIPPLDLKQVEIIKGSVSTLYGGGAIAGLINFISRTPKADPEWIVLISRSTLKETNANMFFAQKWKKTGLTLFAGTNWQNPVDVNKDGFSDLPLLRQYNLHPRFFIYPSERSTIHIGFNGTIEDRSGGDLDALQHGRSSTHSFLERNRSYRNSLDVQWQQRWTGGGMLTLKGVTGWFSLENEWPQFSLSGSQRNMYTEASYTNRYGRHDFVVGMNYLGEAFHKRASDTSGFPDYQYRTAGAFIQDGWHWSDRWMSEIGLRADHHNQFGWFLLPRIAFLYKPLHDLSLRLSAGLGYKAPNLFSPLNDPVELNELNTVTSGWLAERSKGVNFDMNYHHRSGDWDITVNQAFYYTRVDHPLSAILQMNGKYTLHNLPYAASSAGTDTYLRLAIDELELYLGYNHTLARFDNSSKDPLLFAPQDKFGSTIAYEMEGRWRMGLESSWVANQYLDPHQKAPAYWFWAAMLQRNIGTHWIVVLNGENLFDSRQGKHEPLFTGTSAHPDFLPLWGPIEGRVVNLSLKYHL